MSSRLPLGLGRLVQHRSDPAKSVGVLLGWLFGDSLRALVRWRGGAATVEMAAALQDLVEVAGAPPSVAAAAHIRRRMDCGILPQTTPANIAPTRLAQWQPCDGCDELIAPGQFSYAIEYTAPPRVVHLHGACHRIWDTECRLRGQLLPSPSTAAAPSRTITCPRCDEPIDGVQNVLFRTDGRVEHVACASVPLRPAPRAASSPPKDPVGRRRPIEGGAPLPAWALIGDQHIGRDRGTTMTGHQQFMAVCREVRRHAAAIVDKARRVAAVSRTRRTTRAA
jgi:hypothetical protein